MWLLENHFPERKGVFLSGNVVYRQEAACWDREAVFLTINAGDFGKMVLPAGERFYLQRKLLSRRKTFLPIVERLYR
jgi:hypothetical protein